MIAGLDSTDIASRAVIARLDRAIRYPRDNEFGTAEFH
jgi:hypothetical protein